MQNVFVVKTSLELFHLIPKWMKWNSKDDPCWFDSFVRPLLDNCPQQNKFAKDREDQQVKQTLGTINGRLQQN